ncbi:hypothetical protein KJ909_00160 [Patescibacteria group bacterium]|nr:hypothetical protein [Patescibacteria group bacterium]
MVAEIKEITTLPDGRNWTIDGGRLMARTDATGTVVTGVFKDVTELLFKGESVPVDPTKEGFAATLQRGESVEITRVVEGKTERIKITDILG